MPPNVPPPPDISVIISCVLSERIYQLLSCVLIWHWKDRRLPEKLTAVTLPCLRGYMPFLIVFIFCAY